MWLPTATHSSLLHIPRQIARFGFLVACFVHERKHKIAKRWAVPLCIAKQRSFDRAVLEECTMAHVYSLRQPLLKPCLSEAVQACPKVVAALRACGFTAAESALTSQTARVQGRSIAVGDVVLYKGTGPSDVRVGEVPFHAMFQGEVLVCLSHWPTRRETTHWRKAVVSEELSILPSGCMLKPVIFYPNGGRTTVHGPDACLLNATQDPSVSDPFAPSVSDPFAPSESARSQSSPRPSMQ